jgi:DNA-directed RNA polymerase specialized sigma24 family protein
MGLAGPAAPSDAAIIERSVAVPECFAEIFDRHAEGIYRFASRRLGQQAAADVMSEVFLAAFRNRRRYDTGRDDARPWLYGIAVNAVIDHATTLTGRKGIGVAAYYPAHGTRYELIFDPKTYLYIGDSEIALNSTYMPKGTVNGNAVQQIAVVGKPGQLP